MPLVIKLADLVSLDIQQPDLPQDAVRQETDYQLAFTLSGVGQESYVMDYKSQTGPILSFSAAAINDLAKAGQSLDLSWDCYKPGILGPNTMLLVNLVATTLTCAHEIGQCVVGTGCIRLRDALGHSEKDPRVIELRDRAAQAVLEWGLQDGPAPAGPARQSAVIKGHLRFGSIVLGEEYQSAVAAQRDLISDADWDRVALLGKKSALDFMGDVGKNFNLCPLGAPDAIAFNMPFYEAHYRPGDDGSKPYPIPSFFCFNKPATYQKKSDGVEHALLKLLHCALSNERMTPERFIQTVKGQMDARHRGDASVSGNSDFYRCVHVCMQALAYAAVVRGYRYDGTAVKTSALNLKMSPHALARAANRGKMEEVFNTRYHMLTDQLASWGLENGFSIDCEDGCLMAAQLYWMVVDIFGKGGGASSGSRLSEEGQCWAQVLQLFEPMCTRNYCIPSSEPSPPISHILLLMVDKMTFADSMIRGCIMLQQEKGDKLSDQEKRSLSRTIDRLQDWSAGPTCYQWSGDLGYWAVETTRWSSPCLNTSDRTHGDPKSAASMRRLARLKTEYQFAKGKYRQNATLIRDYTMPYNQPLDLAALAGGLSMQEFRRRCIAEPQNTRLYPFYHIITNGDLSRRSICQPDWTSPEELNEELWTGVVFNWLDPDPKAQRGMSCGTFLQRLALAPERGLFIPVGPTVNRQDYQLLSNMAWRTQWPSFYFVSEAIHHSLHEGPSRLDKITLGDGQVIEAQSVLMASAKRQRLLGKKSGLLMPDDDPIPPVNNYADDDGPYNPAGLHCFKLMMRAGVALDSDSALQLKRFVMDTPVQSFEVRGWDFLLYPTSDAMGVKKTTNFCYIIRVFFARSDLGGEVVEEPGSDSGSPASAAAASSSSSSSSSGSPRPGSLESEID